MATPDASPTRQPAAEKSPDQVAVGDRVTLHDPQGTGESYEAVVTTVHSPGCINAIYRPDGDGSFEESPETPEYSTATSVTAVRGDPDEAVHAYTMGWEGGATDHPKED